MEDTAEEVTARGGIGIGIRCDHAQERDVRKLGSAIRRRSGRRDIRVNNAFAGEEGRRKIETYDGFPFWEHDFEEYWYRFFTGYLRSTLLTTFHSIPLMTKRKGGLTVHTLWWNRNRYLCDLFFDVASAGVGRMVYGLALELKPRGISAVAVSPGWTRTERMTDVPPEILQRKTQTPEYIGRAIVNLALDRRKLARTGRIIEVGELAREYGFLDADPPARPPRAHLPPWSRSRRTCFGWS